MVPKTAASRGLLRLRRDGALNARAGNHTVAVVLGTGASRSMTVAVAGTTVMVVAFEIDEAGGLSAHEDVAQDREATR